jgi:hypothetical protein
MYLHVSQSAAPTLFRVADHQPRCKANRIPADLASKQSLTKVAV